ncbi:MAG: divalent-cation tolerance protein CutA [Hyphomicrobium sp.]
MQANDKPVLVYTTHASREKAEAMAARLVERRLAACVNILPGMTSVYRWEGRIETAAEVVMLIKTRGTLTDEVMAAVRREHDYATPALMVLPIEAGSPDYFRWLMAETESDSG